MQIILKAENIEKSFGEGEQKQRVLKGVSLSVGSGEFLSVMGPSGSGKSTLLYALGGMDGVDGGRIEFAGKTLSAMKEDERLRLRRSEMGFVFQQPTLLKTLNILDNILLPSFCANQKKRKALVEKARALMERTGIAGLEDREVTEVSGGQLQRAGICRALMGGSRLLFCDEPTGALDSKSAQEIMELLFKLNKEGTAIVLVTHDAHVAAQTGRLLYMRDGMIEKELRLDSFAPFDLQGRMEAIRALAL